MRTTEVFVEQVLIGFVVLIICTLPFGLLDGILFGLENVGFLEGFVVIAVAYLLGIPADRIGDTLLSGLDQRNRLRFALKHPIAGEDPFAEDLLKISVMKKGGPAWDWLDYLRSRIRLARALTAFSPALTISGVLAVWPQDLPAWALGVGLGGTFLIYIVALFLVTAQDLPKTYEVKAEQKEDFVWWRDPVCRLFLLLVALGTALGVASRAVEALPVGLGGLLLTLVAGWTSWRVTLTFMRFLRDFDRHGRE